MTSRSVVPFSLRDAPAFIERAFPAQKISIEAQAERKANAGQTLTVLGSYWKGRKPLFLCRACILGCLLPATENAEKDLEVFELLMAMTDEMFAHRVKKVSPDDVERFAPDLLAELVTPAGKWAVRGHDKTVLLGRVLARMPYNERLAQRSKRPEELDNAIYEGIWRRVNEHLGTSATSHTELVEQLSIMRFGRRCYVVDTFAGGGSIPFEAARLGCDVFASDLNPIACMLNWGNLNILGGTQPLADEVRKAQQRLAELVDEELLSAGIERDEDGFRPKAFLYCLEVRCPETGWLVPLSGTWVLSNTNVIAELTPDHRNKRFDISIVPDASAGQMASARTGTVRDGHMVYELDGQEHRVPLATLRGDVRGVGNALRQWGPSDVAPAPGDLFQDRLYCVQLSRAAKGKDDVIFRAPTDWDAQSEVKATAYVQHNLQKWQTDGFIPDMAMEPGEKTDEPIRTRGWTYWHHLFNPRQLAMFALYFKHLRSLEDNVVSAAVAIFLAKSLEWNSKLCRWDTGSAADRLSNVFSNQALNTLVNYGARGHSYLQNHTLTEYSPEALPKREQIVRCAPAHDLKLSSLFHLAITDPPYADAVSYHEITEYFIAWLRKKPPKPFSSWIWDSRRGLAIKGSGDDFRREMVRAYSALAENMEDNGLQIVMFTHQDGRVWADMAGIFWAAGLRVTAAWYIATETSSELKKGGYVQGTVILVLRKRTKDDRAYKDELVIEIRQEVQRQIETMVGLNQSTRSHGRSENIFEDADLQMAGYAAALRVLTSYTHIDGTDMTREALRPRVDGERSLTDDVIDLAVSIANEYLVPEGLDARVWERLNGSERFYLRMLDVETSGAKKLDSYQNFAKAFKVPQYQPLMHSVSPNNARLKSATDFGRAEFSGDFGASTLRAILYALMELQKDVEPDEVMSHLRDNVTDYFHRRDDIAHVALYIAGKLEKRRTEEASAARVLNGLVVNERVGA